MQTIDTREWLLTNGLGCFASGTVADVRTRTYHGWFFAATNPPLGRKLLLSHLEASLELPEKAIALGTNIWGSGQIEPTGYQYLQSFENEPVPKWLWGEDDWHLTRQLIMPYGWHQVEGENNTDAQRLLIQYRYEGQESAILRLRILIGDRDFHHQQQGSLKLQFSQLLDQQYVCFQSINSGQFGTPWHLRWTQGEYQADPVWYWNYGLPEESKRGVGDREDLYSPGFLTVHLQPGDTVVLEAQVGLPNSHHQSLTQESFAQAVVTEQERLIHTFNQEENHEAAKSSIWYQLLKAGDQFIVYRPSIGGPTVIAGYHWFNDWGRDTLIALPGLALVTKRFDIAKGLLRTFGRYCQHGLIPNAFPDLGGEPFYNSIDAALWWIETLGLYLEATQDWQFLAEQFPTVQKIHKAFVGGTRYHIHVDAIDGLVTWDAPSVALTWMDAVINGTPITPRRGKPVEINALWYSALCWLSQWAERLSHRDGDNSSRFANQAQRYSQQAERVKASLQKFWNPQLGYLYDLIQLDDRRDAQIRPNAVLALSLHHCAFSQHQGRQVLDLATTDLLTPYGLRSLSPKDAEYVGIYEGSPLKRDRAYHQGTVWSWLIGPYIRAWQRFYPETPLPFDWQPMLDHFQHSAGLGSISEIFDGDPPHTARGAIAQAWSVAEVIRHIR
ncbi:amylo-alpha-1,6-glucosidase [Richelia sinica]|nr:amylo-alpha-1,6-glucosidase [Richelia sinica]MBD2666255.1 amylo-alpha-1,6-glucosidase [Richelia sinica FACHB-800]